jgi:hypothetical protein
LNPLAELGVFEPHAWQHRYEAPARAIDVVHVLVRTQLRIGDVEEIRLAGDGHKRVPSLDMSSRVARVAVRAAEVHGDVAVGIHGQNEEQLLEVGAVVFGIAIGDRRRPSSSNRAPRGRTILPAKANRRGIVVELLEAHAEALPHGDHDVGQQGGAIRVEEAVESSSDAIVAEVLKLMGLQPKEPAGKPLHHFRLTVDRLPFDDDRAQQHAERPGMRQRAAGIGGGHVLVEQFLQPCPPQEVVDQGEGA